MPKNSRNAKIIYVEIDETYATRNCYEVQTGLSEVNDFPPLKIPKRGKQVTLPKGDIYLIKAIKKTGKNQIETSSSHTIYSTKYIAQTYGGHGSKALPDNEHLKYLACYDRNDETGMFYGICPSHYELRNPTCEFCNCPTRMLTRPPEPTILPADQRATITKSNGLAESRKEVPRQEEGQDRYFDNDHLGTSGKDSKFLKRLRI